MFWRMQISTSIDFVKADAFDGFDGRVRDGRGAAEILLLL